MPCSIWVSIATVKMATTASAASGCTRAAASWMRGSSSSGMPASTNGSQMCSSQTRSNSAAIPSAWARISAVASRIWPKERPRSLSAAPISAIRCVVNS